MRILLVSHLLPPKHRAGTETYTATLAKALEDIGHEVTLFCTDKDISERNLSLRERAYLGVPVIELVNNLFYDDLRDTYANPRIEEVFDRVVERVQPEVVHFMHVLYLSVGCVERVKERGIEVYYTLHDFWLQCHRFGQRIQEDGTVCHDIVPQTCAACISALKYGQSKLQRRVSRGVSAVKRFTRLNFGELARRAGQRFASRAPRRRNPSEDRTQETLERLEEREALIRRSLVPNVTRFYSPSRFLLEELRRWGLPVKRLTHLRVGIDLRPFEGFARAPSDRLRVAYLGAVAPHKGVHTLLEAWGLLKQRHGATLRIHGGLSHYPEYVRKMRELAHRVGAEICGPYPSGQAVSVLAETDLVVVPSVWYENSPLVILESLATKTPLIVSDLGGMRELVDEGVSGHRFEPGDAKALAALLERFLEQRDLRDELCREVGDEVVSIESNAERLSRDYESDRNPSVDEET